MEYYSKTESPSLSPTSANYENKRRYFESRRSTEPRVSSPSKTYYTFEEAMCDKLQNYLNELTCLSKELKDAEQLVTSKIDIPFSKYRHIKRFRSIYTSIPSRFRTKGLTQTAYKSNVNKSLPPSKCAESYDPQKAKLKLLWYRNNNSMDETHNNNNTWSNYKQTKLNPNRLNTQNSIKRNRTKIFNYKFQMNPNNPYDKQKNMKKSANLAPITIMRTKLKLNKMRQREREVIFKQKLPELLKALEVPKSIKI